MLALCEMCIVSDISLDSSDSWELLHLNLIPHFLCASEQTSCICALPKLRDCSNHSALPFTNYNAYICIISEGLMNYPFYASNIYFTILSVNCTGTTWALIQTVIYQILTEDDLTPPHCATHIVNKDLSVYLQLRGGLNTEAEREKLRRKREDIQRQVWSHCLPCSTISCVGLV
jgi:hypothetical protein